MALKNYKSFPLLEEYLNYLLCIKGRSLNTCIEYRTDNLIPTYKKRESLWRAGIPLEGAAIRQNCDCPYVLMQTVFMQESRFSGSVWRKAGIIS